MENQSLVSRQEFEELKNKLEEIELAINLDKKLGDIETGKIPSKTVDSKEFLKEMENESNL